MPDLVVTDEEVIRQVEDLNATIAEIEKHYKKAQQVRQRLQSVSRGMKPKMHRSLRYDLSRTMVSISRLIRAIPFASITRRALAGSLRKAVDALRPVEKEIARIQRKLETAQGGVHGQAAALRKEMRVYGQQMQEMEEESGAASSELRRTLQIVERGEQEADRRRSS